MECAGLGNAVLRRGANCRIRFLGRMTTGSPDYLVCPEEHGLGNHEIDEFLDREIPF